MTIETLDTDRIETNEAKALVNGSPLPSRSPARSAHQQSSKLSAAKDAVILIDSDTLVRECLNFTLSNFLANPVHAFSSVAEWLKAAPENGTGVVLYRLRGRLADDAQRNAIRLLSEQPSAPPVVIICNTEDPDEIAAAFQSGVRGYIPTNIPVEVAVQAACLVMAGGTFFPAGSLLASRAASHAQAVEAEARAELFTPRQSLVVQALCRGKPNKVIAYELNMCESTVKVHVRNIMKKLKVKNRTEVVVAVNKIQKEDAL